MIKIALCDDDLSALKEIRALIEQYGTERNQKIVCVDFGSPLDLLIEIEMGMRPDILFLDILMPGENGINVAKEIRQYDDAVNLFNIVFRICGGIVYGRRVLLSGETCL